MIQEDSWLSPPALVGAGALGGAALMYGGSKAIPIIKRWLSSGQSAPQGFVPNNVDVDPSFGTLGNLTAPAATTTPATPAATLVPAATLDGEYEPSMSRTAAPSQNLTIQEAQARMARVTPAAGEFVGPMQPVGPPEFTGPRQPVVPSAAKQAALADYESKIAASDERINQLLAAQEQHNEFIRINNEKIANQNAAPSAAPNSPATKAVTDTIQQLSQAETPVAAMPSRPVTPTPAAALPTGEPAPPVLNQRVQTAITSVPKTVQDQYAKEGKVVLKGYGVGDRSLTNTYGIPAYAKIIDYFNEGKPIGDDANYQIIRKKINQGVPASLAAEFAAKLPGSEAEAGNFGKAFGETGAYTKEGKVVTSPAAMKKAVAGGGALFLATAFPNIVNAAQRGDKGPLLETAFDVGVGAIPVIGTAATALMGTNVGAPTVRSDPYAEVLQRPGVKQVLQNMSQTMSPSEFNVARDQYLSKLSSFPEYNSLRFTKPVIGSNQPINRRTLLPVAPPR